jgi:hypothetical protein
LTNNNGQKLIDFYTVKLAKGQDTSRSLEMINFLRHIGSEEPNNPFIFSQNHKLDISDTHNIKNAPAIQTIQSKLNAGYSWPKQGISTQLFLRHSGKTLNFLNNGDTYSTKSYSLIDMSVTKRFASTQSQKGKINTPISLQIGCKNILGVRQIAGQLQNATIHSNAGNLNISAGRSIFCSINITLL